MMYQRYLRDHVTIYELARVVQKELCSMPESSLTDLAATLGITPAHLQQTLESTARRLPYNSYYVYRIAPGQRRSSPAPDKPRTIVAFPTADDALAFAQRNGQGTNVRLRVLNSTDLLTRMLADATIGAVLFLESGGHTGRGFGPGVTINRTEILDALDHPQHEAQPGTPAMSDATHGEATMMETEQRNTPPLTAKQYDTFRFGVDFVDRAEFRVALTEAVEEIVATYQPPPGSIDSGPRSIFAISAVEEWLKTHGFPHAFQRRWIDVADDPRWGDAIELCEIDGGTRSNLLIQLVIHVDESGRQYIKRVNVTA
jgi:hypothetical protein